MSNLSDRVQRLNDQLTYLAGGSALAQSVTDRVAQLNDNGRSASLTNLSRQPDGNYDKSKGARAGQLGVWQGKAYICVDAGTVGGNDAVWNQLFDGSIPAEMVGFWPGVTLPTLGLVQDLSGNSNHLLYTVSNVDGNVQATAGYWSSTTGGTGISRGFEVPIAKFSPDTWNGGAAGDSIFISVIINFLTQPIAQATIAGNSGDQQDNGIGWQANSDGHVRIWAKGAGQAVTFVGSSGTVTGDATDHRLSMYIDGLTKRMFAWWDGVLFINATDMSPYLSMKTTDNPWWFGGGGRASRDRATTPVRWKDAVILLAPAGSGIKSPAYLDWLLRAHPAHLLTVGDLGK